MQFNLRKQLGRDLVSDKRYTLGEIIEIETFGAE